MKWHAQMAETVVLGHESIGRALRATENANFTVSDLVVDIVLEVWLPIHPLRAVKCFKKWEVLQYIESLRRRFSNRPLHQVSRLSIRRVLRQLTLVTLSAFYSVSIMSVHDSPPPMRRPHAAFAGRFFEAGGGC
jgi:hypothetical protein